MSSEKNNKKLTSFVDALEVSGNNDKPPARNIVIASAVVCAILNNDTKDKSKDNK